MKRQQILEGPGGRLLEEIFAQTALTGCSDQELVDEAVKRGLMEKQGDNYAITDAGREARQVKRVTSRTGPTFNPRGVHCCDEWNFTVVKEGKHSLTLAVFGTDVHPEVPASHPIRTLGLALGLGKPRGAYVMACEVDPEGKEEDRCPYLGKPCKDVDGLSYLIASSLWENLGQDEGRLEQPESFWVALELLARSWCEREGCCTPLTEEEDARLAKAVKRPGESS